MSNRNSPLSRFVVQPGGVLHGRLRVPGDKSISHRAIMLGAIAHGTTRVSGFLEGEDCLATLEAFRAMGVEIEGPDNGNVVIHGVGRDGLTAPAAALDLGNSGTSLRLLAGLLTGQNFSTHLTGDASLSRRPMLRVTEPLSRMGANIEAQADGTPPLTIRPAVSLKGIRYEPPVASAQVKSALLLAGLYAQGKTCINERTLTRDHTERMLEGMGYRIEQPDNTVCLEGGGQLSGAEIEVPGDISSASFLIIGATIATGSELWLEHVGVNPTRTGIIDILKMMGADIRQKNHRTVGGEPVADIEIRASRLKGIRIPESWVPRAIDEFPAIFVAAACAEGETVLTGAEELRVKESDRIQVMADSLNTCGIQAQAQPDGIVIQGGALQGGRVDSHGDHRIAMAMSIAALRATDAIEVLDCQNVETSFPGFAEIGQTIGLKIKVDD